MIWIPLIVSSFLATAATAGVLLLLARVRQLLTMIAEIQVQAAVDAAVSEHATKLTVPQLSNVKQIEPEKGVIRVLSRASPMALAVFTKAHGADTNDRIRRYITDRRPYS